MEDPDWREYPAEKDHYITRGCARGSVTCGWMRAACPLSAPPRLLSLEAPESGSSVGFQPCLFVFVRDMFFKNARGPNSPSLTPQEESSALRDKLCMLWSEKHTVLLTSLEFFHLQVLF